MLRVHRVSRGLGARQLGRLRPLRPDPTGGGRTYDRGASAPLTLTGTPLILTGSYLVPEAGVAQGTRVRQSAGVDPPVHHVREPLAK